jgi:hypothetical protein
MPSGSGRGHPPGFMLVTKWRENVSAVAAPHSSRRCLLPAV